MSFELKRRPDENEEQFIWRVGLAKDAGEIDLSWYEITDIINKEFRADEADYRNECVYRKAFQQAKRFYESGVFSELSIDKYICDMQEQQRELRKLKQQITDERTDYQRTIREQARQGSFVELVERVMERHIAPFAYTPSPVIDSDDDMIVCLSDLHAGIDVRNYWNTYNIGVLQERMFNYLDQISGIQATHQCKVCDIVLAGDAISGLIHNNLRLENNENVVEQLKIAVTYIGNFVDNIRKIFERVRVHSVAGNHSRLSPKKEDHIKGENLDELIPFCLNLMFAGCDNVEICEDGYIDESINTFTTRGGKLFYVVHGDKDVPSTVVQRLTLMTGVKPDGVIMAHRHHNAYDTEYNTKILQSGCVVGTDNHCVDLRIVGEPEQVVAITNSRRTVKCFYDVGLS